jgi:hypothetical protein
MRGHDSTGRAMVGHARRGAGSAAAALLVGALTVGAPAIAQDVSPMPTPSAVATTPAPPGPRHIDLALTSRLQILDRAGQPVRALAVRPGETLEISVGNQARFAHNLFIGDHDLLAADQTDGMPGVDDFSGGVRTFTWVVPTDVHGLWFGCTVVGHFSLMQGPIVAVADTMPDLAGLTEADALALLDTSGLFSVERRTVADPTIPAGTVLAQQPAPGSPVDPTTVVELTVAADPTASPGG